MTMLISALPAGVHPADASWPPGEYAPHSEPPPAEERRPVRPFATRNGLAVGVNQRAAEFWSAQSFTLSTLAPWAQLSGRRVGKRGTQIWVPAGAAQGVNLSPDQGTAQVGYGVNLNVGDSIFIATEAPVYAGLQAGQTVGACYVVDLYDPILVVWPE
jgi:hypothetical protein